MSERKIIAVMGATGAQGGGLVRAILADPTGGFAARAITRRPASDKAKELESAGAQVMAADADDQASLERAFAGVYGVFCVTNYWEHMSPERELAQAGNMARAARAAGVQHVVWSTLEDTRQKVPISDDRMPTLMGRYKVPHFDAKGEADRLFTEAGAPTTFLRTSFYWDNLIHFGMQPKRGDDGVLDLTLPMGDARLPGMAAADIGPFAYEIFKRGNEMIGRTVAVAGEHLTGQEMAAALERALGEKVRYNRVSPDAYRAFGFPGADDLGNMFQFKSEFEKEYTGARDLRQARSILPSLKTFDTWLQENAKRIPIS